MTSNKAITKIKSPVSYPGFPVDYPNYAPGHAGLQI